MILRLLLGLSILKLGGGSLQALHLKEQFAPGNEWEWVDAVQLRCCFEYGNQLVCSYRHMQESIENHDSEQLLLETKTGTRIWES